MSEYQYYEFRAIDRPLNQKEMDELRALSTRAEITPTSFTNEYNYGDFRGKPETLMERYFDAFVYVANWGTRRLMFRVPRRFLDARAAAAYVDDETFSLRETKDHLVLEFSSEEEEGEWAEGDHWMGSLVSVRDELMRGDLRALYIGWLAALEARGYYGDDEDDEDDDEREPPVPPGLARLSAPLKSLAEFLRVDDDLIEAAAAASAGEPPAEPSRDDLARWVKDLPLADKDAYLLRFCAEEGDLLLRAELMRKFREATAPKAKKGKAADARRTVKELRAARDALAEEKRLKEAERKARERTRLQREKAAARSRHLDELAPREADAWREVDDLIATKRPKDYDRAVDLLVDLRDLAARSGRAGDAAARVQELRRTHGNKPSLIKRFNLHDLGT